MTDELKACPFCGGTNIKPPKLSGMSLDSMPPLVYLYPRCQGCGASAGLWQAATIEEAIAAWNRRSSAWISVDERLPEDEVGPEPFIAAWLYPNGSYLVRETTWLDDHWLGDPLDQVAYWQPMQPSPEGGEHG